MAQPAAPPKASDDKPSRDFLLHLEAYLARRDGVDKLLKISRYATKILLASSLSRDLPLAPRLKAFESSVGVSRKAFRLGKFVQDVNAFRAAVVGGQPQSPGAVALIALAYGGEGVYYFLEQFVWLAKAGLVPAHYSKPLQWASAWAELVGYVGSVAIKIGEVRRMRSQLASVVAKTELAAKSSSEALARPVEKGADGEAVRKLREKLLLKELSIVQDLADALMALADVRDGKGPFTGPLLMASAGLVSALISADKNWRSC